MITLRLGSSVVAVLFLVPAVLGFVLASIVAVVGRSLPAAGVALLLLAAAAGLLRILLRRGRRTPGEVVVEGRRGKAVHGDVTLVFARHSIGAWSRQGALFVAEHGAVFLPMGSWTHLAFQFVQTLIAPTLRFADVSFELGDPPTPEALAEAAERYGGFLVGPDWTLHADQRWLHRKPGDGIVVLAAAPPEGSMRAFPVAPRTTRAEARERIVRIAGIGAVASVVLVTLGGALTALTGEPEFLMGLGCWALIIPGVIAFAAVIVLRQTEN